MKPLVLIFALAISATKAADPNVNRIASVVNTLSWELNCPP